MLLFLPVETGLARAKRRSEPDRFESEKLQFFENVRHAYLDIAQNQPERVKVIDASQALDKVQHQIQMVMQEYLKHD